MNIIQAIQYIYINKNKPISIEKYGENIYVFGELAYSEYKAYDKAMSIIQSNKTIYRILKFIGWT